jgi:hypothetical protein
MEETRQRCVYTNGLKTYENLDPRIDVHRQTQNFIIPEFIFNFGKLGDYKIFGKLLHSVKFR